MDTWEDTIEAALISEWQLQFIAAGMKIEQANIHAQARMTAAKAHFHAGLPEIRDAIG